MKAYLDKIMKLRPTVQATFRFYLALIAAFDFPLSSRANSLHGPVALCGLLAAMSYTKSCGNRAAKLCAAGRRCLHVRRPRVGAPAHP